jgi:putative ABC transport system ATP-binding protein
VHDAERERPVDADAAIRAEGLAASYGQGRLRVQVLQDLELAVLRGETVAVTGPSGSGKTTLLAMLGGLDRPDAGRLLVDGVDLTSLSRAGLIEFRRRHVGFVFQAFHLLPGLTAEENVAAGVEPLRLPRAEVRRRVAEALDAVGIAPLARRFPHELSGGEQQRVAVARAGAKRPALLLADEPTGNLDARAAESVLDLLLSAGCCAGASRPTTLVATHDPRVAARTQRVLTLRGGRLLEPPRECAPAGG